MFPKNKQTIVSPLSFIHLFVIHNISLRTMKKLVFALFFLIINSCTTSYNTLDADAVDALLAGQDFSFCAKQANTSSFDALMIMNNFPGGANKMNDLGSGYGIKFEKNEMEVALPYFGRAYSSRVNSRDSGFRWVSKDYTLEKTKNKKGNWIIRIQSNDQKNINRMVLEVFKNGKSYLSVDANDRQPISYDGYIEKNPEPTK